MLMDTRPGRRDGDGEQVGPVAEQFMGLGQALLQAPPGSGVVDVLQRVVSTAAAVVPAADVVSVTLREADGTFHTPAATSPVAEQADRIQFETGEGPCVDATAVEGLVGERRSRRRPAVPG